MPLALVTTITVAPGTNAYSQISLNRLIKLSWEHSWRRTLNRFTKTSDGHSDKQIHKTIEGAKAARQTDLQGHYSDYHFHFSFGKSFWFPVIKSYSSLHWFCLPAMDELPNSNRLNSVRPHDQVSHYNLSSTTWIILEFYVCLTSRRPERSTSKKFWLSCQTQHSAV